MWKLWSTRWCAVLGFALGGFFDGILLHQILQWHHLLSLVPGFADLRLQVLWDGYFHALMYVVAASGLWGLWRAHGRAEGVRSGPLLGGLLIGFGAWHGVDAVLSHWLLGLHRIKLDSEAPLLWDVFWLLVFGAAPLAAGWLLLRSGRVLGVRSSTLVLVALTTTTAGMGAWSLRPPPDQSLTTIVFRPDFGPHEVLAALAATQARLVWADPSMAVVVVDLALARRWSLYVRGAMLVSGLGLPAGCVSWSKA